MTTVITLLQNGLLSALPYLLMVISSNVISFIADKVISKKLLSVQTTRKLFNSIAHIGPAAALVALSFIGCNQTLAIVCLCLALSCNSAMYSGFMVRSSCICKHWRYFLKVNKRTESQNQNIIDNREVVEKISFWFRFGKVLKHYLKYVFDTT